MKPTSRVIWNEGLLMTPQHLQQLDRFHEWRLDARLEGLDEHSWGALVSLLDVPALDAGMVALSRFEGVLPDGTTLAIDQASRQTPPARPIEGHLPAHQAVLEVFLALPRTQEARSNVAMSKGSLTRYFAGHDLMHDRYGEAEPQEVDLALENLCILFGDEPRDDFTAMKVAEIHRAADGRLEIADDYVLPCMRVSASPALSNMLDTLLTAMNARRGALLQTVRQRGDSTVEFTASDVTRYLLLSTINGYLPILRHLVVAGDLSAKSTYLILCQLLGELSTFSTEFDPNDIPKFVYEDLRSTFGTMFGALGTLLKATLTKRFVSVDLVTRGDAMHNGELTDERLLQCSQFLVGVQSSLSENEVASILPRVAKLASASEIHSLLAAATSGVELHATMKPPPQIPTRAGTTYFVLRTDTPYWRNILVERRLGMYIPNPFLPMETKVTLFGVLS